MVSGESTSPCDHLCTISGLATFKRIESKSSVLVGSGDMKVVFVDDGVDIVVSNKRYEMLREISALRPGQSIGSSSWNFARFMLFISSLIFLQEFDVERESFEFLDKHVERLRDIQSIDLFSL